MRSPQAHAADVLLDVRMHAHSGIGTYVRALRRHLCEGGAAADERAGPRVVTVGSEAGSPRIYSIHEQLWYRKLARDHGPCLLHAPHLNVPLRWPGPLVVTVHDLALIRCRAAARSRWAPWYARVMLHRVAARAEAIICVSEATRDDLVRLAPKAASRCTVIRHGVDEDLARPPDAAIERVLGERGLSPGYVLYLGNVRPHKNVDALIAAHRLLPEPRPLLVIAGTDQMPSDWSGRSAPGVRMLGRVPDKSRAALYAGAAVFCFPSLFEGFGLPPVEAMRCGTPAVCSDIAALREVAGAAAAFADARRPEALAEAIGEVLANPEERARRVQRGLEHVRTLRWSETATATRALYAEVLRRRSYSSSSSSSSSGRAP